MEIINNGYGKNTSKGYSRIDRWNDKATQELSDRYKDILRLIGEDPDRPGL